MKTTLIAIAFTSLALTPSAFADSQFPFEFAYDKQELATEEGANRVYKQLRHKIEIACDFTSARRGITAANIEKKCIEESLATVLSQMEDEKLAMVHEKGLTHHQG